MKKTLLALFLSAAPLWAHGDDALIKRGEYLARAADCTACHTAPGGPAFGGGYPVSTPFGVIYGSNISADKQFGIGNWSDDEFVAAVRDGVGKNGQQLYPAMPYDAFTKMKRDDVLAIKAYLLAQPAVHQATPRTDLAFPFNQRWGMRLWKLFNFSAGELRPDPAKSDEWNHGRYLVEALAHCGTCHTPRTLTMGMDEDNAFAGGDLGGWTAYNITPDKRAGIGSWSQQELVDYLKTGNVAGRASAAGPMAEAIEHSLQYLPDGDLHAMATYLRSVTPIADDAQNKARDAWGQPTQDYLTLRGGNGGEASGAALVNRHCASCHGADGAGKGSGFHAYPSLLHHGSTGAADNKNLVAVILGGVQRHMQQGEILMPAFAGELRDDEVATLSNYVNRQFGNPAAANASAEQVARQRQDANLPQPPTVLQGDRP
ncbi:MAG: c-type cytochrome [Serratia rubidaea]|nr:c-type cytochrome [Serratia rubidaea]